MKYFNNCKCIEDLKQEYKKLAMLHHPDITKNDGETMKIINNEYDSLFEKLKDIHKTATGETYTKETSETASQYKDIINKIIHFENCKIEIIGSWIWVSGNTKEYKEILKELKFRWIQNKTAWCFHNEPYKKKSKNKYSLDDIKNMFGVQEVQTESRQKLQYA